ncbi:MAG: dienelactone hydrolase family protein [Nitrospirae bacterium]|nr:MAG: dienelactone hydrolase family protein [Nitrospirota bacterium]
MKKFMFIVLFLLLVSPASYAEVVERDVLYSDGETALEGYLAYDSDIKGKSPGVLIIHEWTGINDYIKRRAHQIAELGYVAFAADIYGKGVRPKTIEEASRVSSIYKKDVKLFRRRLLAGLKKLRSLPQVDETRVAAIGYCFGGTGVLELARTGADLRGVVSFHGSLYPEAWEGSNIRTRVLVFHGGDDPFVSSEKVLRLWKELQSAGVMWEIHIYGKTVHSFTNPASGDDPSVGVAYNPYADRHSWQLMKEFLEEVFK